MTSPAPIQTPSSDTGKPTAAAVIGRESLNLPNLITISRFVLALVLFGVIDVGGYWIFAAGLFAFAASTDWLDGYLARKYGQITVLGRILDPFVDKIIVGGTFLFLLEKNDHSDSGTTVHSGVTAWMVITVIGREMFVSSLRGVLEQQGKDFSASLSGKAKMLLQCVAVTAALLSLSPDLQWPWLIPARDVLLWSAVAVTVWSGLVYVIRGARLLKQPPSGGDD
ncbi:MAG: CDP-diacylglycerol--glycerol-3-phosphate 3-phosphatidyltransferase [Planctomycetaceae bacterium]|nr:CDP-diacylglycerol--glycerol-3-phosphate 3-phosphatidyltransferase [Planctomycetaceae bacterium]